MDRRNFLAAFIAALASTPAGAEAAIALIKRRHVVQEGDTLGSIDFIGRGPEEEFQPAARIEAVVDESITMPGRLVFRTGPDYVERMRITNTGITIVWMDDWPTGRVEHAFKDFPEMGAVVAGRDTPMEQIYEFLNREKNDAAE